MNDDARDPRTHATHPDSCRCLMCTVWGKDPRRPGVYPAPKKTLADDATTEQDEPTEGEES